MNDEQVQEPNRAENEETVLAEQSEQQMRNLCPTDELRSTI
jgi:hypothetical protein